MVKLNSKVEIDSDEAIKELRRMILDSIEAGDAEKSVGNQIFAQLVRKTCEAKKRGIFL